MNCPKCGSKAYVVNTVRGATTLIGMGAGGYVATTVGAKAGATTGAVIGHMVCPGLGTAVGSLLGILVGAASGAIAGNTVGRLFDENIARVYRCESCDHTWRV